jgi:hypothetical protein
VLLIMIIYIQLKGGRDSSEKVGNDLFKAQQVIYRVGKSIPYETD